MSCRAPVGGSPSGRTTVLSGRSEELPSRRSIAPSITLTASSKSGSRPSRPWAARNAGGPKGSIRQSSAPAAPVAPTARRTMCSAVSASSDPAARAPARVSSVGPACRPFPVPWSASARRRQMLRWAAASRARARSRLERSSSRLYSSRDPAGPPAPSTGKRWRFQHAKVGLRERTPAAVRPRSTENSLPRVTGLRGRGPILRARE